MKIAVNTRLFLKDNLDGIGIFAYESFKKIIAQHPTVEFIFIFDRKPHPEFLFAKNINYKVIYPPARHIYLLKIWHQFSLPRLLRKINADIFVGIDGMLPLTTCTKTLAIIHDLNFEHYPNTLPKQVKNYYLNYFPKYAKKATRIATVSNFSKQDIINKYNISASKIDVVYNGVQENFKPITKNEKETVYKKYTQGKPFFLFVGSLHPRKNLTNLFKAFDTFKTNIPSDLKLLIVGKKMWWTKEIENTFNHLNYKSDILFTGRIPEKELYPITAAAFGLTYVSIFEGFGIPLIEAMKCGVPVITSNTSAMPEVVENAAILVDPFSVKNISKAMEKVYKEPKLRADLIEKGILQAKKFSCDKTADLLWQSILKTINA